MLAAVVTLMTAVLYIFFAIDIHGSTYVYRHSLFCSFSRQSLKKLSGSRTTTR